MMKNIILLGAPGAGKGTQAEIISDKLSIPIISTGNILKQAISDGTALGMEAKTYMDEGKLVPDATIIGIVKDRLNNPDCLNGFILDGVPRTLNQADALQEMGVDVTHVISLEVPDDEIMERITGRMICSKCGSSYHKVTKKPAQEGVCDRCGGELVTRPDDNPETVQTRLDTYHEQTEPLKSYYAEKGLLQVVDGIGSLEEISQRILAALEVEE